MSQNKAVTIEVNMTCDRCNAAITTTKEIMGSILVVFESPLMPEASPPAVLCSECGKKVAEFIFPEIVNEPVWRKADQCEGRKAQA